MAVIGWLVCILVLLWFSVIFTFALVFGGEEFSLVSIATFLKCIPVLILLIWLWSFVIQSAPFKVISVVG